MVERWKLAARFAGRRHSLCIASFRQQCRLEKDQLLFETILKVKLLLIGLSCYLLADFAVASNALEIHLVALR